MKHSGEVKAGGMKGTKLQAGSLMYLSRVP